MAFTKIDIPGGKTNWYAFPTVQVIGTTDESVTLVIRYHATERREHQPSLTAEVTFVDVFEYRWQAEFIEYEDLPCHRGDFTFGLIEILESQYVENMASKGSLRKYPGKRFGSGIAESDVRHFRIAFDDYGRFDVIAMGVKVEAVPESSTPRSTGATADAGLRP